ncbi:Transposable element Tc1 transposase, partial [Araneus ventricosus]
VPMMGTIPQNPVMPPSTMSTTVQAPPKPLFPAAVAQASASSQMPVGTDFKPLMSTVQRPTFPAYSGNSSPSMSGHPSSTQGAAPILYNTTGTSSPQVNSEPKRSATIVPADNPSSKIMHPDEDLSLEEIRAQLPKYQMYLNMSRMPMSMMAGKMPMPGGNPMMMNGMMRPGTMAVPPACIPLTPNHCRLRCEWSRARAHWRTEWRSVVFSDESRFCLCASDGRVVVKRRTGQRLQPTCLQPRHTGPTPEVMVWGAISYDSRSTLVVIPRTLTANLYVNLVVQPVVLPFMNSIQGRVLQQDNNSYRCCNPTSLQSVDMLPWPARSPDLSPIEHVWDIIGRQLQHHPQSAVTIPVLTNQMQQAWNSIPQTGIQHLYNTMYVRLHACIQNSGIYTGY